MSEILQKEITGAAIAAVVTFGLLQLTAILIFLL